MVAALLSEMALHAGSRTVLVFDDVHTVEESEAVVSALSFMVDGLPPGWIVVFSSRRRLPFPVIDLRQRDRLAEVDLRRLRLTPSEVEEWARGSWGVDLTSRRRAHAMASDRRMAGRARVAGPAFAPRWSAGTPRGGGWTLASGASSERVPRGRRLPISRHGDSGRVGERVTDASTRVSSRRSACSRMPKEPKRSWRNWWHGASWSVRPVIAPTRCTRCSSSS